MVFQTDRPNHFHNYSHRPRNSNLIQGREQYRQTNKNNIQGLIHRITKNPQASIGSLATRSVQNIPKTLSNIQEVLKVAQSSAPIIEKYGPIVRNIPTMYRIMKAINENDQSDGENNRNEPPETDKRQQLSTSGQSRPRLYI